MLTRIVLSIVAASAVTFLVTRHWTPTIWTLGTCGIAAFVERRWPSRATNPWVAAGWITAVMLAFWFAGPWLGILER